MRITVLAVSRRLPGWIDAGIEEYSRRLPPDIKPQVMEITPARRGKQTGTEKALGEESGRIRRAIPESALMILLDERGKTLSTQQLAAELETWTLDNRHVTFIIGGADGVAPEIRDHADAVWSLSALTLPHGMARLLLVEQLYRAWSILNNHPYHRE